MVKIIKDGANKFGCDAVVCLDAERRDTKIKLLQLTDMQVIDAFQRRTPERLRNDEINAWIPEHFDILCGNQIRSLIAQTNPDLIFITGDMVYGSFDDQGTTLQRFCEFMDSLKIPWAPTFGNHDNESKLGVDWQCQQLEKSSFCLFHRGTVTGNSNYSVGIAVGEELVRVLYMIDSNGCLLKAGIYPDQIQLIQDTAEQITNVNEKPVPAFCAFHIPTREFVLAEEANGYKTEEREFYTIGVDVPAKQGDFGFKLEKMHPVIEAESFLETMKKSHVDGVFVGHCHSINTCMEYEGIRWVLGLKTGQYDYHIPGNLGGTLITLEGERFAIQHLPSLSAYGPMPGLAPMFKDFFAEDQFIIWDKG